jgi:hypothetical protein
MGKLSKDECVEQVVDKGVLAAGGPGTYLLLGGSDTGKNFLLQHMLEQAHDEADIKPSNIIAFSTTAEYNDSLDFLKGLAPKHHYAVAQNQDELLFVHKRRAESVASIRKVDDKWKQWIKKNPMWIIIDDFGGCLNLSTSQNNPFYSLVTSIRHLGIYMFLLVQYKKAVGPSFYGNLRLICSFDVNAESMKHMAQGGGFNKFSQKDCVKWMKKPHYFTMWWITWQLDSPKPQSPWYAKKIKQGELMRIQRKLEQPNNFIKKEEMDNDMYDEGNFTQYPYNQDYEESEDEMMGSD